MDEYGFMRVETYGFKGHGAKKDRTIRSVIAEATRMGYCSHVEKPLEPVVLRGHPTSFLPKLEMLVDHAKKNSGGKMIFREDSQLVMAFVISFPTPVERMREVLDSFKTDGIIEREAKMYQMFRSLTLSWLEENFGERVKLVLEHWDEGFPHIHAYVVPVLNKRETLRDIHPGLQAFDASEDKSQSARHKAYRTAMRAFQDDFHAWVGVPLGWKRNKGVKRVSRATILTRKHEEKSGKKKASEVHTLCTPPLCT